MAVLGTKYGESRPFVMPSGYVRCYAPEHPLANKWGHVMEHRKVAWDHGIITDRSQIMHHVNGDRSDNRPENLQATSIAEHAGLHYHGGKRTTSREEYRQHERERYEKRNRSYACVICGRVYWNAGTGDTRGCSNHCRSVLRYSEGWLPKHLRICEMCERVFRCRVGDGRACSGTCRVALKKREAGLVDGCTGH